MPDDTTVGLRPLLLIRDLTAHAGGYEHPASVGLHGTAFQETRTLTGGRYTREVRLRGSGRRDIEAVVDAMADLVEYGEPQSIKSPRPSVSRNTHHSGSPVDDQPSYLRIRNGGPCLPPEHLAGDLPTLPGPASLSQARFVLNEEDGPDEGHMLLRHALDQRWESSHFRLQLVLLTWSPGPDEDVAVDGVAANRQLDMSSQGRSS